MDSSQPPQLPPPGWHDDPQDPTSLRYWDGTQWTANRAPKSSAAAPTVTSTPGQGWTTGRLLAVGGCTAVIVGSFMPWVSVTTIFGTLSVNGSEGDGVITAVGAVIALVLVLVRKYIGALVVIALTAAILVYDMVDISRVAGEEDFASASVGWGLYLAVAGAACTIVGSILARSETSNSPGV